MADVDALTRRFGPLIASHYCIAEILHRRDGYRRPLVYESTCFLSSTTEKFTPPNTAIPSDPIIPSIAITNMAHTNTSLDAVIDTYVVSSSPVIFIISHSVSTISDAPPNSEIKSPQQLRLYFRNGGV